MRNYCFLKPRLSLESSAMNHQVATRGQLCIAFGHHLVGPGVLWKVSEQGELPWWLPGKEPACSAGETQVQSPGGGDPLEEEMATPLKYFCLGNPMDRGTWWVTVHGVARSQTLLRDNTFTSEQGSDLIKVLCVCVCVCWLLSRVRLFATP